MKIKKFLFISIAIIGILSIIIQFSSIENTQADETQYSVDISTTPASGFLIAENMAPGDKKTSILTVSNNGNLDFNYSVSARQEAGITDFFNRIRLTLTDNQGLLYDGFLSNLIDFPLGTIVKSESETLTFTAELPFETGNEVQGQSTTVAFDFAAVGHEEEIPIGDDCFEPPFSNSNFTLQQRSTVPIKFHLRNDDGTLDDTARSGVRLEVTGPNPVGGVIYTFSISDGTLKFDQNVDEPHYLARFSTKEYSVITDENYTATVYDGDQVMCYKSFDVLDPGGNRSNSPN